VSLHTTDMGAAWVLLKELLASRSREAEGLADPLLGHARKPLVEHLDDWAAAVLAAGTTTKHADLMRSRVGHLALLADWKRLPDLTVSTAARVLASLLEARTPNMPARYTGRSAQTRNHFLSHLKQFCRWCVHDGRLARHPLLSLTPGSVEADRRHDRRSPTDQEVATLFSHLASPAAKKRSGMSGPQRSLAYQVSMATGLRGGEVRTLTRESFDLGEGSLTVRAAYSKRRRKDTQLLPTWLVAELTTWFAAGGGLWAGFHPKWPGRQLKADLALAGVPFEVKGPDGPLFFDFHALRHWYCSKLASMPGISPKTLMELCRHSSAQLTLSVYAHAQKDQERAAVDLLPQPGVSRLVG
jgi:integrase